MLSQQSNFEKVRLTIFAVFACESGCANTKVLLVSISIEAFGIVQARFEDGAKVLSRKKRKIIEKPVSTSPLSVRILDKRYNTQPLNKVTSFLVKLLLIIN